MNVHCTLIFRMGQNKMKDLSADSVGNRHTTLFLYMCVAFVVCLLVSNIIAGKVILVFGVVMTAGTIIFPITYILGDVFTEVYGFRAARRVIWIGFACNFFAVLVYLATIALPYPGFWKGQEAYVTVMGTSMRIFAASLTAYLFGSFLNAMSLSKIKVAMNGKRLWYRMILSSLLGHAVDTFIFTFVAFWGVYTNREIWEIVLCVYVSKCGYEIVLTPVTYAVINRVKKIDNIDVYDVGERYNPFFKGKAS